MKSRTLPNEFFLVLMIAGCGGGTGPPGGPGSGPPYMPQSEFWQKLPASVEVDPGSAGYVADMLMDATKAQLFINISSYNVPIVAVPAGTARISVQLSAQSPQRVLSGVPLPSGTQPAAGSDAHLVVLDDSTHTSYELWQAKQNAQGWHATEGLTFDTTGDGINHAGTGIRATSLSLLLGVLTYDEVSGGGPIEHALAWAFDRPNSLFYTSPAASGDGDTAGGNPAGVPQGARLQLDPALDVTKLGLSAVGQRIARALQEYGMFMVDSGGDSSLVAEYLEGGRSWSGVLTEGEVMAIPMDHMRVLRLRDQISLH